MIHQRRTIAVMIAAVGFLWSESAHCQAVNVLNRIVATTGGPTGGPGVVPSSTGFLVFTDCDTMVQTSYPLPQGFIPRDMVTMDRNGDVWLNKYNSYDLHKFGSDGAPLAIVPHPFATDYMVCDQQANLIVGSVASNPARALLYMYSPNGQLLRSLDLATLLPPGSFVPYSTFQPTFVAVSRILVTRSGSLWVGVWGAFRYSLLRLASDWTLAGAYEVFHPGELLPDEDEGVWSAYYVAAANLGQQMLGIPNTPPWGWVHLSANGIVSVAAGAVNGGGIGGLYQTQVRSDGRWFSSPAPGAFASWVGIHEPWYPSSAWYSNGVNLPGSFSGSPYIQQDRLIAIWLDCGQNLWALRGIGPISGGAAGFSQALTYWLRLPPEAPYSNYVMQPIGNCWATNPGYAGSYVWATQWGDATLQLYCYYTDPFGDLDGDGVPNREELRNKTNPLVHASQSMTVTSVLGPPGTWIGANYAIPGDAGLPYFAPFAFLQTGSYLGWGYTIPFALTDPLVMESLTPTWPWITGSVGTIDFLGNAQVRVQVPAMPSLTGLNFFSNMVTWNPLGGTFLKTVAPATTLIIQ